MREIFDYNNKNGGNLIAGISNSVLKILLMVLKKPVFPKLQFLAKLASMFFVTVYQ